MLKDAFPIHSALLDSTRFDGLSQRSAALPRARTIDIVWLLGLGVAAAVATSLLDFRLRIPGHAILRSVPWIALGLATIPRRNGGWLLGSGTALGILGLSWFGGPLPGLGAGTSLLLMGPILELALYGASTGGQVYLSFALAGVASNLAAFFVRATPKLLGLELGRGKSLAGWGSAAIVSYALCGLLAGVISAWICFRLRRPRPADRPGATP